MFSGIFFNPNNVLILVSDAGIKPGTTDGGVCQMGWAVYAQYRDVDQDTYEPRENQRSPEYYRDGRYVPWAISIVSLSYNSI